MLSWIVGKVYSLWSRLLLLTPVAWLLSPRLPWLWRLAFTGATVATLHSLRRPFSNADWLTREVVVTSAGYSVADWWEVLVCNFHRGLTLNHHFWCCNWTFFCKSPWRSISAIGNYYAYQIIIMTDIRMMNFTISITISLMLSEVVP